MGEKTTNIERSSAEELGCRYLLRQNKIFKGFSIPTPPPSQGPVSFALTTFTKLSVLSNIHFLQLSPSLQGAIFNFQFIWVFMGKG